VVVAGRGWFYVPSALVLLLLSCPQHTWPQSTLSTLRGRVRDSQSQIVPNATVLVIDDATGIAQTATVSTSGDFELPFLRAGQYRIEVRAAGFSCSSARA
jgi:hypothetical protein